MRLNKDIAISTSNILLVPYEPHHVPTYHEWMKDKELQAATASEPLSLAQEYAMQASWRTDADKLTFIACQPLPLPPPASISPPPDSAAAFVTAGTADAPARLLGDINLFLSHRDAAGGTDECARAVLHGELELMIAPTEHRRRGHGRSALLALLLYLERHVHDLVAEYHGAALNCPRPDRTKDLALMIRVKIASENLQSRALFRGVGFEPLDGGADNYFGEVEMGFPFLIGEGKVSEAWAEEILTAAGAGASAGTGTIAYHEMVYQRLN